MRSYRDLYWHWNLVRDGDLDNLRLRRRLDGKLRLRGRKSSHLILLGS